MKNIIDNKIAEIITEPQKVSLTGKPNFIEFEGKNVLAEDVIPKGAIKLKLGINLPIDTELTTEKIEELKDKGSNLNFEFKDDKYGFKLTLRSTYEADKVDNTHFLIEGDRIQNTIANLKECLLKYSYFSDYYHLEIPSDPMQIAVDATIQVSCLGIRFISKDDKALEEITITSLDKSLMLSEKSANTPPKTFEVKNNKVKKATTKLKATVFSDVTPRENINIPTISIVTQTHFKISNLTFKVENKTDKATTIFTGSSGGFGEQKLSDSSFTYYYDSPKFCYKYAYVTHRQSS